MCHFVMIIMFYESAFLLVLSIQCVTLGVYFVVRFVALVCVCFNDVGIVLTFNLCFILLCVFECLWCVNMISMYDVRDVFSNLSLHLVVCIMCTTVYKPCSIVILCWLVLRGIMCVVFTVVTMCLWLLLCIYLFTWFIIKYEYVWLNCYYDDVDTCSIGLRLL